MKFPAHLFYKVVKLLAGYQEAPHLESGHLTNNLEKPYVKTKTLSSAITGLALALTMSAAVAGPVLTPIFTDQFNRSNSDTVGNSWVEINHDSNEVAIVGNALKLSGQKPGALGTVASPDAAVDAHHQHAGLLQCECPVQLGATDCL
jgi:hypothetical protein